MTDMIITNTIEGIDQIRCALSEKHRDRKQIVEPVFYNISDFADLLNGGSIEARPDTIYYGILTAGDNAQVELFDQAANKLITIEPQNQVIEAFSGLTVNRQNADESYRIQFRGVKIRIDGLPSTLFV